MKKLLTFLFVVIVVSTAFAEERIYKLHCDSTPPFIYWSDPSEKTVTGIWAETVRSVMKNMGEKHEELRIYTWPRLLDMGLKGEIDGVFSAVKTEEREKSMWYPKEPLMEEPWIFWIRKKDVGKLKFDSYDDLKGHRIGLVRDYTYSKDLWDFVKKEKNYEEVSRESLNFRKLVQGKLDYIASALHVGIYTIREEGIADQVHPLTEKEIVRSAFYIMFNKQKVSEEWVNRFSDHLAAFKKTSEYNDLMKKFGFVLEK